MSSASLSTRTSKTTTPPRPCLKQASTSPPPSSSASLPRSHSQPSHVYPHLDASHLAPPSSHASRVHFPPTPILSTTFPTHSKKTYDRRPLVVSPNACAMPERGCPGRTYVLERGRRSVNGGTALAQPLSRIRVREPGDDILDIAIDDTSGPDDFTEDLDDEDDSASLANARYLYASSPYSPGSASSSATVTPTTPTPRSLPALVPDHGISSSESDESDALTSPNGARLISSSRFTYGHADERMQFLPHPPPSEPERERERGGERERDKDASRRRRMEREEECGRWKTRGMLRLSDEASCLGGF